MDSKFEFASTLADTIYLGMSDCYRYGMCWGCDIECPVLQSGKCELQNTENKYIYEEYLSTL